MKTAYVLTILGILITVIFLGIWSRKRVSEGFETTPECTYSDALPGYMTYCANNVNQPFFCSSFGTLEAAKTACSANQNCRGITMIRVGNEGTRRYTIRVGGDGSTDYTNLNKMKMDMLNFSGELPDGSPVEESYLITNLLQCKPNTPASRNVNPTNASGGGNNVTIGGAIGAGAISAGPPGGLPMGPGGAMPEFMVSRESITVPADTLVAVPAGQTIFAKRMGAGSPAGGPTESSPAPVLNSIAQVNASSTSSTAAGGTYTPILTEAEFRNIELTAEERFALSGLPLPTQIKIVDATRRSIPLFQALTQDELNVIRARRQQAQAAGGAGLPALASTPSTALSSSTGGNLTSADLLAIQQAAAAGAAQAIA